MLGKLLWLCALGALLFSGRSRLPRLFGTLRRLPDDLREGHARAERPDRFARDVTPPRSDNPPASGPTPGPAARG